MRSATVSGRWRAIGLALALLALASCGGGGSSAPPGSKLFIVDAGNHAILSFIDPLNPAGIDRVVTGSSTGLGSGVGSVFSIPSIALDATGDRLYAATQGNTFIFDNAGAADGNVPYSRLMSATVNTGGVNHAVNFFRIDLDKTNNILYTVDPLGEVHVFNNASTGSGATPNRTIVPDVGMATVSSTFGIAIDAGKKMLYVGVAVSGPAYSIIVFNNADTANATTPPLPPNRTLNFAQTVGSFFLDTAQDRLYVAQSNGVVLVFDSASTLATGTTPTPNRTITLLDLTQHFIFVDVTRDKLYAVANPRNGNSTFLIVDNASTSNDTGPVFPDGPVFSVTGPNIQLSAVAVKP